MLLFAFGKGFLWKPRPRSAAQYHSLGSVRAASQLGSFYCIRMQSLPKRLSDRSRRTVRKLSILAEGCEFSGVRLLHKRTGWLAPCRSYWAASPACFRETWRKDGSGSDCRDRHASSAPEPDRPSPRCQRSALEKHPSPGRPAGSASR